MQNHLVIGWLCVGEALDVGQNMNYNSPSRELSRISEEMS